MPYMLRINEFMSFDCVICQETYAQVFRRVKGIRAPVLTIPLGHTLIISPDYNSAFILTHFHIELVARAR